MPRRRQRRLWPRQIVLAVFLTSAVLAMAAGPLPSSNAGSEGEVSPAIGSVQMLALASPRVLWLSVLNPRGSANVLYRSSDGGQQWTRVKTLAPGLSVATAAVASSSQAILAGPAAYVWITQDEGQHWVRRSLPGPTALPLFQVLLPGPHGTVLYLALRGQAVIGGDENGTVYETSAILNAAWSAQTHIPGPGIKSGMGFWAGRLWVTGLSRGNGEEVLDHIAWPLKPSSHWSAAIWTAYALPKQVARDRAQTELQSFPPSAGWLPVTANNRMFFDRWQDEQWTHPVMAPIQVVPGSTPVWAARGSHLWAASGRSFWRRTPNHPHGIRSTPIQAGAIVALSFITAQDGAMVSQWGAQVTIWRTNDGGKTWRVVHRFIGPHSLKQTPYSVHTDYQCKENCPSSLLPPGARSTAVRFALASLCPDVAQSIR